MWAQKEESGRRGWKSAAFREKLLKLLKQFIAAVRLEHAAEAGFNKRAKPNFWIGQSG
jgi:hypothetical protein